MRAELNPVMEFFALLVKLVLILGIVWLSGAITTLIIAINRGGNMVHWTLFSFLLGPFGIFLALKLTWSCPHCRTKILREVRTCPKCQQSIPRMRPGDNPLGPFWTYRRNW